jgi:peroxiredoxin
MIAFGQSETKEPYATISYDPVKAGIFTHLDRMEVVYVANFWNTRMGTRMALRENILRPDTSRVMTAPLVKQDVGWEAKLAIPPNAAVLSYYITDGEARDENGGKTFTAYVYTAEGVPVPNAHYFMVPFLELAGASLEERVREAEQEILQYPQNFRAYTQYFTLYLEIEEGSERGQRRIIQRLGELEQQYGDQTDCLNLIARTYYYILRNLETALEYKDKIPQRERWPEVERIVDTRSVMEQQRQRQKMLEEARNNLVNTVAPEVHFRRDGEKISVQDYEGKPVVLVFWATTSELSKGLFKPLENFKKEFDDDGLTILAINAGERPETVDEFREERDYPFVWAMNDGAALQLYGVSGLPQTYIIDRKSVVRQVFVGYTPALIPDIKAAIKDVL